MPRRKATEGFRNRPAEASAPDMRSALTVTSRRRASKRPLMKNRTITLLPFSSLAPESIQGFLDDLATISLKHGVVLDFADMMPIYPQVAGYFAGMGGYLTACTDERMVHFADESERLHAQSPHTRGFRTAFADLSAHDRLRILRDLR